MPEKTIISITETVPFSVFDATNMLCGNGWDNALVPARTDPRSGAMITHITTHAMHHRGQCLNMLKHLGVKPLPPSSVMQWAMMAEAVGMTNSQ